MRGTGCSNAGTSGSGAPGELAEGRGVKVPRSEGVTKPRFLREPCVGSREGAGEASAAVRMDGAIEQRKDDDSGCRGFQNGRRQHHMHRYGEMHAGPAVSENPCTSARLLSGPWEVFPTAPSSHGAAQEEWRMPKPVMNGWKKSDEAVRPVMAANKGARAPAEPSEERASTKGNPGCQSTRPNTESGERATGGNPDTGSCKEEIRRKRLAALFHHITPETLRAAYFALEKHAAAGVRRRDVVHIWRRAGRAAARPCTRACTVEERTGRLPVRRVEIPKPDGGTRPLGIAALEDKIVQKAVVDVILTTDLRGGIPWVQLWVSTGPRGA